MTLRLPVPPARTRELIIQHFDDEMLIYDRQHLTALCLNPIAALVFQHIDGTRTAANIADQVRDETNTPLTEDVVMLAVNEFNRFHLLQAIDDKPSRQPATKARRTTEFTSTLTRRQVVARLGIGAAAVTLPVVASIIAPTAAQAATCRTSGIACSASAQCCSGLCTMMGTCA
ncbi:MAG: hypothetical protein MSG64_08840 [Pyrinomonadaceae bacterium MAG19_C2-C3]|nr:hypothetical protein [Pyrinomonadaceae bacterium MAG19_C2-C3]